ncbi:NADAR family protein [Paenibacillus sp. WQ 127069]|uniref:NADAR family protein n=1 Tax=Paenibacillus baimaensis TaxID=2982185 RepID=A0ABT2UCL1_9BACL|nr:NADAR family protein [Paenibacillus sp. WQ 127069]MCU6792373.1 NADAR family protein [Paenibacillus sp. WQ 127069]
MEKFTFFYRTESPFSQWHPAEFVVSRVPFNCSEQFMMYQKAKLFKDEEMAEKILLAKSPAEQKQLGRMIRKFHKEEWEMHCKQFVYDGNYAKFTQNQHLLERLLETKGTTLVEASPTDRIWGVGLLESSSQIRNRKTWRGTNWLGEVLTNLREDLISQMK